MPDDETPEGQEPEAPEGGDEPQEPAEKPVDFYAQFKQHGIDLKEVNPDTLKEAMVLRQHMGNQDPRTFFAETGRRALSDILESDEEYRERFLNEYLLKRPWMENYIKGRGGSSEEAEEEDPEKAALIQEALKAVEARYGGEFGRMREELESRKKADMEREYDAWEQKWNSWLPGIYSKLSVPNSERVRRRLWSDVVDGMANMKLDGSSPEKLAQAVKTCWEDLQRDYSEFAPKNRFDRFTKPGGGIPRTVKAETKETLDDILKEYEGKLAAYNRGETIIEE